MPVMDDPEMRTLFSAELVERSTRLVEAAQLARSGTATDNDLEMLRREAHTIKGTGRMMGFSSIGDAAYAIEQALPKAGDPRVASAIEQVGGVLPAAAEADPDVGTAELSSALEALTAALEGRPEPAPQQVPHSTPEDDPHPFPLAAPGAPEGLIPGAACERPQGRAAQEPLPAELACKRAPHERVAGRSQRLSGGTIKGDGQSAVGSL